MRKIILAALGAICLILAAYIMKPFEVSQKTLFILYDAGPSNALKPVMQAMEDRKQDYAILAYGTASQIFKDHPKRLRPNDNGFPEGMSRLERRLSGKDLAVTQELVKSRGITTVISGLSSMVEVQDLEALPNVRRIAYYDAFSMLPGDFMVILKAFLALPNTTLLVPTKPVKEKILELSPKQDIRVVGQPSLAIWIAAKEGVEAEKITKKLGAAYNPQKPTILYAGGYENNDNHYNDSFKLFLKSVQGLDVNVVVTIHPKVNGSFEKEAAMGMRNVMFAASKDIKTESLVYALNKPIVVTQRSSVGVQAYFAGFPVMYVDTHPQDYSNFLIDDKKVGQYSNPENFETSVHAVFEDKSDRKSKDLFAQYDIPENAVQKIIEALA